MQEAKSYNWSCSAVWSARRPVKAEVASSNLVRTAGTLGFRELLGVPWLFGLGRKAREVFTGAGSVSVGSNYWEAFGFLGVDNCWVLTGLCGKTPGQ